MDERVRLEIACLPTKRTQGSNPCLSANWYSGGNLKGHASRFSLQIFFTFAYEARRPKAGFFSSLTCKNLLAFIIFVSIIMKEENINNFMISKYGK